MSTITCKNCQALENIIARKVNWFNLLSAENISLHHSLVTTREQIARLQDKVSNLQKSSYNDQQEIVRLYIETEYLKYQNKNPKNHIDTEKFTPLIEYQKKIQIEQEALIASESDLWKKQSQINIQKLEEHIKVLLEELEICHKELVNQTKHHLNERQLFRELATEEKLKSEMKLNNSLKENEQIKRQDDLISVLKKQQDTINRQYHKLNENKNKTAIHYKNENRKFKEEYDKLRVKYEKLEERRSLEVEGYRTQIKLLTKEKTDKK
ncbi:hypothetical protein Trydic_g13374 [Trypoxylus dichotomus]